MSPIASAFRVAPGFLPHGYCISWDPLLLWLTVVSDGLTALAYYSIPMTIVYFLSRRRLQGYTWVAGMFAGFILACGTTHLMAIVTLWRPDYWLEGWIKAGTAALSLLTAALLWPLLPKLLALPTPSQLQNANALLQTEVDVRRQAEAQLRHLHGQLEQIVSTRTGELVQARDQLEREVAERKRLDRFKDELIAMVSHELRTPLTSIAGSLQTLASGNGYSPSEQHELVQIAQRNSERLIRLVNSLLDLDRIESGRVEFNMGSVALSALVQVGVKELRACGDSAGVRIALCGDAADALVRGDPDRLMQVLSNLIGNAVKHAPRDSEVSVTVEDHGDRLRVSVADQGPGIPKGYRERIFEKFVQLPRRPGGPPPGSGLGLSIAKVIVERHQGRIGLESTPGAPTVFYFELPVLARQPA